MKLAFRVLSPTEAVIVGFTVVLTAVVFIINVVLDDPIGTVMPVGIIAADDVDFSFTAIALLPAPAVAFNEIVPLTLVPPITELGLIKKLLIKNGFTVSVAV